MWGADVCNSISLKRTKKAMKRGRRNKMSGAFFFLFFHRPMASQKMFPCVVSEQTESKERKHSLLQTTCNRFFLKPNKSTPCFRSCDTFCALCYSQHILFQLPAHPHSNTLSHTLSAHSYTHTHIHAYAYAYTYTQNMHIQTFHFLCVRSPGQGDWRASMQHAQAGKQEGEFKGVQHEMLAELGETQSPWQYSCFCSHFF